MRSPSSRRSFHTASAASSICRWSFGCRRVDLVICSHDSCAGHQLIEITGRENFIAFEAADNLAKFAVMFAGLDRGLLDDSVLDNEDRRDTREIRNRVFRYCQYVAVAAKQD